METCMSTIDSAIRQEGTPSSPPHLVGSYILAGTSGMLLWDIVIHLRSEYELLLKQKVRFTTIIYFVSRLTALCGVMCTLVLFTTPLDQYCSSMVKLISGGLATFFTSTSFLLYLRVRAVYTGNKRVVTAFFLSFLAIMCSSTMIPYTGIGAKIGPTNPYCTVVNRNTHLGAALLMTLLINNIAVFVAISIKLMPAGDEGIEAHQPANTSRAWRLLRGNHLPRLSRTLWQDGQKYVLASVITTLLTVAFLSVRTLPEIYGFILVAPHAAVESSMNCYMIRNIRASSLRADRNVDTTLNVMVITELENRGQELCPEL
ncbi:hypothetical protein Moror_12487 [Moniliophthora roreri MCA 2997]|uniref:Uncharacterized protein n=2 Tax=Moniliophthora roreri TaxID=221103 RepID=V2X9A8_MONRO|nr:hypothetical protein Moror_12487 [Moniliophthora roreri MCA 2997]KAI3616084.1 hypothetical protein WG66_014092 [Moniliophthora roreri]